MKALEKLLKALKEMNTQQPSDFSFTHKGSQPDLKRGLYHHNYDVSHKGKPVGSMSLLEDKRAKSAGLSIGHNSVIPDELKISHANHILGNHPILDRPGFAHLKSAPKLTDEHHQQIKALQELAGSHLLNHFQTNERPQITPHPEPVNVEHPIVQQIKANWASRLNKAAGRNITSTSHGYKIAHLGLHRPGMSHNDTSHEHRYSVHDKSNKHVGTMHVDTDGRVHGGFSGPSEHLEHVTDHVKAMHDNKAIRGGNA